MSGQVSDDEVGVRVVAASEMEPASVIADIPDTDFPDAEFPEAGAAAQGVEPADASESEAWPADDRRWHEILLGLVNDPLDSVQAATDLLEDDLSAFAAFLSRRRQSLLSAAAHDGGARIEQMRRIVVTYRDISRQLAASTRAVS